MKFKNIAGALGWTEEPSTQEGLFLQPEECATIDKTLADNAAAVQTANENATTQATRITELENEVATVSTTATTATDKVTTLTDELATATARIAELEELSGKATKTAGKEEDKFEDASKVSANDMAFQKELYNHV